uniref:Cytochrome b561 domain-containing protein n=1 Tax=Strongyloides papillosus TaxID=174720 RepID=A0A0N5BBT2_STREA
MYLFTETILSSCPHEDYCRLMTILSLIALFFQTIVAFTLIKEWKTTKSDYTKFLTVIRTIHVFYNLLGSTIGEFRLFLPRKTAVCHGIIRFFGDYACGLSL